MKKVLIPVLILFFWVPLFSMERENNTLEQNLTELVQVLNELSSQLSGEIPSELFPLPTEITVIIFQKFVNGLFDQYFEPDKYRAKIIEAIQKNLPYVEISSLADVAREIDNFIVINKQAKAIAEDESVGLNPLLENIFAQRKFDRLFFSREKIPALFLPTFKNIVQENQDLKGFITARFKEILEVLKEEKNFQEPPSPTVEASRTNFLSNFYMLGLLDDVNPPQFYLDDYFSVLPEAFIIRLLERLEGNINDKNAFMEVLDASSYLDRATLFNYVEVIDWLLKHGVKANVQFASGLTRIELLQKKLNEETDPKARASLEKIITLLQQAN